MPGEQASRSGRIRPCRLTTHNIDKVYDEYKDWADSFYVNTWYTEDQIDALFQ